MPSSSGGGDQSAQRLAGHHGAGRVWPGSRRGRPSSGLLRWAASSAFGDSACDRRADVSINTGSQPSAVRMCRYAGSPAQSRRRGRRAFEHRKERQVKPDEPGGDDDPSASDLHTHRRHDNDRAIRARSEECRSAAVNRSAGNSSAACAPDRRPGRGLAGWSDFKMNDVAAGRLDPRGRGHHVHHHDRRHIACARTATQA